MARSIPEYYPQNAFTPEPVVIDTPRVSYFNQEYGIINAAFIGEISDHYSFFAEVKTNLLDDD